MQGAFLKRGVKVKVKVEMKVEVKECCKLKFRKDRCLGHRVFWG